MLKKISLIGLLVGALLIVGCSKKAPEPSSTPTGGEQVSNDNQPDANKSASTGNTIVKFETTMGDIVIELNDEKAPITVKNFLEYVESGFYNGTIFHRVVNNDNLHIIQAGGFTENMGRKNTNAPIKLESYNGLKNDRGAIAMARTSVPDSATSQFYINNLNNDFLNYSPAGNPGYAVFGKVIEGIEVVDKIAAVRTTTRNGMQDVPVDIITIESASVVSQ